MNALTPYDDDDGPTPIPPHGSVTFSVRMSAKLYAGIMREARKHGLSRAALLRLMATAYLRQRSGEGPPR